MIEAGMRGTGFTIHAASLSAIMAWMAVCVHGCYPQKLSPECQAQINACLESCPEEAPDREQPALNGDGVNLVDVRSDCESLCHRKCR
jgi:hypothetical protein